MGQSRNYPVFPAVRTLSRPQVHTPFTAVIVMYTRPNDLVNLGRWANQLSFPTFRCLGDFSSASAAICLAIWFAKTSVWCAQCPRPISGEELLLQEGIYHLGPW